MRIQRVLAVVAMTAAALSAGSAVQAAPTRPATVETRSTASGRAADGQIRVAQAKIDAVTPYLDAHNKLDAARAVAGGVDRGTVTEYTTNYAAGQAASAGARLSCPGAQMKYVNGIYVRIWLNACTTRNLVKLMAGGATLSGAVAFVAGLTGIGLPLSLVMAGIGSAYALGAWALDWCGRNGRGVQLRNVYWPPCLGQ